jgi:hypothetical protein
MVLKIRPKPKEHEWKETKLNLISHYSKGYSHIKENVEWHPSALTTACMCVWAQAKETKLNTTNKTNNNSIKIKQEIMIAATIKIVKRQPTLCVLSRLPEVHYHEN